MLLSHVRSSLHMLFLAAALLWMAGALPAQTPSGNVVVSTNTTWNTAAYSLTSLTVNNGAILTVGGASTITVSGAVVVTANSNIVLQSINNTAQVNGTWQGTGVSITAGSAQVDAGSSINADGQGYVAADNIAGAGPAGASDSNHGGSYGGAGYGQLASSVYGSATVPVDLGSAGFLYSGSGGNGGGALRLLVLGTLTNNGLISANAGVVTGYSSGGAGGSVYVTTQSLSGSGSFSAVGASNPGFNTKDGGGGRIAVSYLSATGFSGFTATTASGGKYASVGTAGFFDSSVVNGNLSVYQNFTFAPNSTIAYNAITVENAGVLTVGGATIVNVAAALTVTGNSTVNALSSNNTVLVNGTWQGVGVTINTGSLQVDSGSTINANGTGYVATDSAPGAGPGGGSDSNHGGSYGGAGYGEPASAVYGSSMAPSDLGSAGSNYSGTGGNGGGALKLQVSGTLTNNGMISANAQTPTGYTSGGAGGSVFVITQTLSGAGTFTANGGLNPGFQTKDGGGGRIAVDFTNATGFTGFAGSTATGGVYGSPGTVIFVDTTVPNGNVSVYQNFALSAGTSTQFNSFTLAQGATLSVGGGAQVMVAQTLHIAGTVTAQSINNTALVNNAWRGQGVRIFAGSAQIDPTGSLSADAQGYVPSAGPAPGSDSNHGGSYGGFGSNDTQGTYGSATAPIDLGSGGSQYAGGGGYGGGAIELLVSGTLTNNGSISANADTPTGYSSGAAGGSVYVGAHTVAGTGTYSAAGGVSASYASKNGGGGRVAVDYIVNQGVLPAALSAAATASATPGTTTFVQGPVTAFLQPTASVLHGVATLAWFTDAGATTSVTAAGPKTFTVATGSADFSQATFDTTTVPDGAYELRLSVLDASGAVLQVVVKDVVINNSVQWYSGTLTSNTHWTAANVYAIEGTLIVPSGVTLTIDPGTVIKALPGAEILVQPGGILNAQGTAASPVIFTTFDDSTVGGDTDFNQGVTVPSPGEWNGIVNSGGSYDHGPNNVVRYAQTLLTGSLAGNTTLDSTQNYEVGGNLTVPTGVTLTIQPGTVIKFDQGSGLTVQTGATLLANGTLAQPIYFTSINDVSIGTTSGSSGAGPAPGDWNFILIDGGTASFQHVQMTYGGGPVGSSSQAGMLETDSTANVTVTASTLASSYAIGIQTGYPNGGGDTITVTDTTFYGNQDRAINAYPGSVVHVVNSTMDSNAFGIFAHGGTVDVANTTITNDLGTQFGGLTICCGGTFSSLMNNNVYTTTPGSSNYQGLSDPTGSNGNLSQMPVYMNGPQHDYRPTYGSPLIDAGNGTVPNYPQTDAFNVPRYNAPLVTTKTGTPDPSGLYPDIGAFEFVQSAPSNLDFTVSEVSGPSTALVGSQATVTWTVTNVGTGTAYGPWHDAIYLITSPNTNPVEILAGQALEGAGAILGPGAAYTASATIAVPGVVSGEHRWEVKTNVRGEVFEGANTANNTGIALGEVNVDVPQLSLGAAPTTGSFASAGASAFYQVIPAASQAIGVQLALTGGAGGSVQVFIGAGYVPSPQHYDYQQTSFGAPTATVAIPSGSDQTYYVTAFAQNLPGGSAAYTIQAITTQASLTGVSPNYAVNQGQVTLVFTGGGFTSSTRFNLVDPNGNVYAPTAQFLSNSTTAEVTFPLAGAAVGIYSAQAVEGQVYSLANAITVTASSVPTGPGGSTAAYEKVQVTVDVPDAFRAGFPALVTLNYANVSGSDIAAPLIYINSNGTLAEVAPPCTGCDPNFPLKYGKSFSSGMVLGISNQGPAGVLPAGQTGSLQFIATPPTSGNATFYASAAGLDIVGTQLQLYPGLPCGLVGQTPMCQFTENPTGYYKSSESFCYSLMPQGTSINGYGRACSILLNKIGYTYTTPPLQDIGPPSLNNTYIYDHLTFTAFNALLAADATALSASGVYDYDVQRLLSYELAQDNLPAFNQRYHIGEFGYGPGLPFDISLTGGAGSMLVDYPDGSARGFNVPSPTQSNVYLGGVGDYGTMTIQGDGSELLTEPDGTLYHFPASSAPSLVDTITDRNGNKITLTHAANSAGGLITTGASDNFGNTLTFQHNAAGLITGASDGVGRTATFTYDTLADGSAFLTAIQTAQGTTQFQWTEEGTATAPGTDPVSIANITYPDGGHTYFTYDSLGRLASQSSDNSAQTVTYTYNKDGSITQTDALGKTTTATGNEAGRPLTLVDPLGGLFHLQYDPEGKAVTSIGPMGNSSHVTYDGMGNPASASSANGSLSDFSFIPDRAPTSLTDPSGAATQIGYDNAFDLTTLADASGAAIKRTFNAAGRPLTRTNRRGATETFTYLPNGLLASKTYSNGQQVQFTYDPHGNLNTVTSAAGVATFTFDPADRLTAFTNTDGRSLQYTYNSLGQRSSMTDSTGFVTNYLYDTVGRLSSLADKSNATIVSYTYDATGRLATKTLGNGTSVGLSYDAAGNPLSVVNYTPSHGVLSEYDYTYDGNGRPVTQSTPTGNLTYTYDQDEQLTGVATPSGPIQYVYDASGNRTSVTSNGATASYLPNNLNQYQQAAGTPYLYDADGNVISGNGWTYTYNDDNKVLTMVNATDSWSFSYDGLSNRVGTVHNGKATRYLIDPTGLANVEAEFDGTGALLTHFTYGFDLTSQVPATGGANYYAFDGTGNTTQITDASGKVVDSYAYLPFGEQTVLSAGAANPFTFAGQTGAMDDGTGLYFMRNRWYNPALGRFQQIDPIGIAGGENLYTYVGNSPLAGLDPQGLDSPFDYLTASISAIVSVGASVNLHNGEGTVSLGLSSGAGANLSVGHINGLAPGVDRGAATSNFQGGFSGNVSAYTGTGGGVTFSTDGTTATEGGIGFGASGGSASYSISNIDPQLQAHLIPLLTLQPVVQPSQFTQVTPEPGYPPPDICGTCITIPMNPITKPVKDAQDPNGKITSGYGDQGFVPAGVPITYTIYFENQATATLPAQNVTVTDALSANLDWSTVDLTQIAFNNVTLAVPSGTQTYSTHASVSTDPNPVQVTASLNPATGVLTWNMRSVDAVTGSTPANPLAGFLPPNSPANAGVGSVTFTVMPTRGLANATTIANQGSITFDANAAIVTNTVSNTLDTSLPTSAISPLPGTTSSARFTVSWTGADPTGAGIANYNIYASTDNGPYALWLSATTLTSSTYQGIAGHSYSFVSLATNNVGIQQTQAAAAQTIAVTGGGPQVPAVTVTPAAASITTVQTLSVGIAVTGSGTPTGSVVLSSGAYSSPAVALNAGSATIVIPAGALPTGTDALLVTYTPDAASAATFASSTGMATVTVTASVTTQQVTVGTVPAGLTFSVDGTAFTSTQTLTWTVGSTHTLATTSPQTTTVAQQTFTAWSDGGAIGHTVTATAGTTSYSASFGTAYPLTTVSNPVASGTVTPASGTYYAAGTVVSLVATPAAGYLFSAWTGPVASSTSASTTVTMTTAQTVTANFTVAPTPAVTLTPAALSFSTAAGVASAAQTVQLQNTGNGPLTISAISVGGPNAALFTQTGTCGGALAASASCTITVTFTPSTAGSFAATLNVTDNAGASPQSVALSGTAAAAPATTFNLVATPQSMTIPSGSSAAYLIKASPQGGAFPGLVQFTVSGLSANATATFAPASITPGAAGATTVLTVQTSRTHAGLERKSAPFALCAVLGLLLCMGRRRRGLTRGLVLTLALCAAMSTLAGCGATRLNYTLTVTGTSGATVQTTTVILIVE